MLQAWLILRLFAQISGLKPGTVKHDNINCHLYGNQIPVLEEHLELARQPKKMPTLDINPNIKSLDDIREWVTVDDFTLNGYESHPPIKYPFSK